MRNNHKLKEKENFKFCTWSHSSGKEGGKQLQGNSRFIHRIIFINLNSNSLSLYRSSQTWNLRQNYTQILKWKFQVKIEISDTIWGVYVWYVHTWHGSNKSYKNKQKRVSHDLFNSGFGILAIAEPNAWYLEILCSFREHRDLNLWEIYSF
jgi:hypothetical protein